MAYTPILQYNHRTWGNIPSALAPGSVWRIQIVLMRIRIPLFMLIRIRIFLQNLQQFFAKILQNLSCVIFSVTMWEEWRGVRDKG